MKIWTAIVLLGSLVGWERAHQDAEPEVALTLVCDAPTIGAGETFEVAALFELEHGWHIYWKNAGDSGAPTTVELEVPEGFVVEGPAYPAPERVELPGDLTSFAYHDEVALFFRVTAPADLEEGAVITISARADWLVCKEVCFLGDAVTELELVVGGKGGASAEQARALERNRRRLPGPMADLKGAAYRWESAFFDEDTEVHHLVLGLRVPAAAAEFFPDPSAGLSVTAQSLERSEADAAVLRLELTTRGDPQGKAAAGVLELRSGKETRYYEIHVPVGASPTWR